MGTHCEREVATSRSRLWYGICGVRGSVEEPGTRGEEERERERVKERERESKREREREGDRESV